MSNNFSQLLDLAIKQGYSRSSLIAEIKQTIIGQYREQNPKAAIGIAVLIDEETGLIKIFAGNKEVGSEKFSQDANQLAQKILIDKIAQSQANNNNQTTKPQNDSTKKTKKVGSGILGKILFWAYNIYFIFFNFSMALSLVIGKNFMNIIKSLDWAQALIFLGIFFLPIVTVIYVLRKGLQHQSASLMKLFFLLELPLAVLFLLFSNLIGHTTIFTALSLLALLAIPLLLYIHFSKIQLSVLGSQIMAFFSQFSTLILGYYVLLFSFFLPLIVIGLPKTYLMDSYFFDSSYGGFVNYPGMFIQFSFALLIYLLILALTILPFILLRILWKISEKNRLNLMEILGEKQAEKQIAISWVIVLVLFLMSLFRWPDHRLLSQLNKLDQEADYSTQETSAAPLIKEEEKLQKLVKRKVEARSYYLFDKDDSFVADAYEQVFENITFSELIQGTFTNLAYPLVYWEKWEEQRTLTDNFQYLFGYPYYESKSEVEEEINLRFIEPEETENVLLTYRQITVNTEADGLLANVTIEEEYQNQTSQEQEIIYEFNLPDEVAFYDLKLGPNLEYSGVIAPKGAAQKVYERELQQRRDPALLEQTGPNQYRLRIFPVPGQNDFNTLQGQRQKVAFSYSVAQNDGAYALPNYTKESNILIDGSSSVTLSYDGQISYLKEEKNQLAVVDGDNWDLCQSQDRIFSLLETTKTAKLIVHANDAELQKIACGELSEIFPLLKKYRLAIVYDTSFNNQDDKTLEKFSNLLNDTDANWLNETQVDLYKFNQVVSQGEKLSSDNFKDLLEPVHFSKVSNFSKLSKITAQYDLVILVTSQDIDFSQLTNFPFSKPSITYWVSENKLPALNMEMTSGLWQTGGGTSTTIETALRNFLIKKTVADKYDRNAIVLNQKLSLEYAGLSANLISNLFSGDSALAKISNKALLAKFVSQQDKEVVGDINLLDQLDAAARSANLVSPYSSAIALVNQQQIANLKQQIEQYNRYQDTQMIENVPNNPRIFISQPLFEDTMIMRETMPMMMNSSPGINSFSVFDTATTKEMPLAVSGGLSNSRGSSFGSLINFDLVSGNSFMMGTGLIAVIAFVVYLFQQLRKRKEK